MLGHVFVHILGLDLEEQRVCICIGELTASPYSTETLSDCNRSHTSDV